MVTVNLFARVLKRPGEEHVLTLALITLTHTHTHSLSLSLSLSLSIYLSIVSDRSSRVHPVSVQKISSSWSFNTYTSVWRGSEKHVAYELVFTSPTVSRMSCSSNLDFLDGRYVASQLLFYGMLLPGFVYYSS